MHRKFGHWRCSAGNGPKHNLRFRLKEQPVWNEPGAPHQKRFKKSRTQVCKQLNDNTQRWKKSRVHLLTKYQVERKKICAHLMQQTCRQCGSILKFWKTKPIRPFADIVLLNFLEGEHLRRLSAHQAWSITWNQNTPDNMRALYYEPRLVG